MITELFRGISINHDICLYLTGGKNSIDTFGHIHDWIDITLDHFYNMEKNERRRYMTLHPKMRNKRGFTQI